MSAQIEELRDLLLPSVKIIRPSQEFSRVEAVAPRIANLTNLKAFLEQNLRIMAKIAIQFPKQKKES